MRIGDYPVITAISSNDLLLVQTASDGAYKSIQSSNLGTSGGSGSSSPYVQLLDSKTSGASSSTAAVQTWTARDLNTIAHDDTSSVTISSNTFTLPSGTYYIDTAFNFYITNALKIRLFNVTDNSVILYGIVAYFNKSNNSYGDGALTGKFAIGTGKSLSIQYYAENPTSSPYNNGAPVSDGSPEIYGCINLWKVG